VGSIVLWIFKMKPKVHTIIEMCLESGINRGWYRAHKHTEHPKEETIKEEIENCIMSALNDYFTFDDNE